MPRSSDRQRDRLAPPIADVTMPRFRASRRLAAGQVSRANAPTDSRQEVGRPVHVLHPPLPRFQSRPADRRRPQRFVGGAAASCAQRRTSAGVVTTILKASPSAAIERLAAPLPDLARQRTEGCACPAGNVEHGLAGSQVQQLDRPSADVADAARCVFITCRETSVNEPRRRPDPAPVGSCRTMPTGSRAPTRSRVSQGAPTCRA